MKKITGNEKILAHFTPSGYISLADLKKYITKDISGGALTVKELNMRDIYIETPTTVRLIPNIVQTLEGTETLGVITSENSLDGGVSAYFNASSGSYTLNITVGTGDLQLLNFKDEPTRAATLSDLTLRNRIVFTAREVEGVKTVQIDFISSENQGSQTIFTYSGEIQPITVLMETSSATIISDGNIPFTIDLQGEVFDQWWQTYGSQSFNFNVIQSTSVNLDLSKVEDGTMYLATSYCSLFDKVWSQGDFIQFYGNKTGLILYRQ